MSTAPDALVAIHRPQSEQDAERGRRRLAGAGVGMGGLPSGTCTFVFTDIVDSTKRASAVGDAVWRRELDAHDAVVRHELARFGGREVNTTGDGFVATFPSAVAAQRCAATIREAVAATVTTRCFSTRATANPPPRWRWISRTS